MCAHVAVGFEGVEDEELAADEGPRAGLELGVVD